MANYEYFLVKNRQRLAQWNPKRRNGYQVIPQAVLHTFEWPPERSMLGAASYLLTRTTPGSYHFLAGGTSEKDVLPLAPVSGETWHCVPSNNWSIGISAATYASAWGTLSAQKKKNFVHSMAYAAYLASQELIALGKSPIPAKKINREEAMEGVWGFTYHRDMDPGRRTDPANPVQAFPWNEFLAEYKRLMGEKSAPTKSEEDEIMKEFLFVSTDSQGRKHHYGTMYPAAFVYVANEDAYITGRKALGRTVEWWDNLAKDRTVSDPREAFGEYIGPEDFRPKGA